MKVCAIVPTYNRKTLLLECLKSLFSQSREIDRIIVIDDGSSDGTAEHIEHLTGRIDYFRQENAGKAAALNRALELTDADLIWICDDDDVACPTALQTLIAPFTSDPEVEIVFAKHRIFSSDGGKTTVRPAYFSKRENESNLQLSFWEDMFSYQFSTLTRRSVYIEVGPFDVELKRSQDYDMALRMSYMRKCIYLDKIVFHQREHDGPRGPGGQILSNQEVVRNWFKYDQIVFKKLLGQRVITDFTPDFAKGDSQERALAAAWLERGLVLSKRGLWDDAVESFRNSADFELTLSRDEMELCAATYRNPMSFEPLAQNKVLQQRLKTLKSTKRGTAILFGLYRSCRWMIANSVRERDWKTATSLATTLVGTLGPRLALIRLLSARPAGRNRSQDQLSGQFIDATPGV